MAERETIAEIIGMMRNLGCKPPEAWQGMRPSQVVDLWQAVLADVADDDLRRASLGWVRGPSCAFFPMPGQLLAQIGAAEKPVTEADRKAAGDAVWAQLQRAYQASGGQYGREDFDRVPMTDVARQVLESVGGWMALRKAMIAEDNGFSLGELGRSVARMVATRSDVATPAGVQALIEGSTSRGGLTLLRGGRA